MLFERVVESRCCFRDAAEAVPQQIKLMVNAFAAMLSHHARADLPLGNKLDDMLFQIVKFREDSWLRAKFAVVIQERFNVRQKREAYAHRSLIDLFTAKVLPAKAHFFAKNIVGTDFLLIFNTSKFTDYTRSLQDLNKIHFIEIIARELRSLFLLTHGRSRAQRQLSWQFFDSWFLIDNAFQYPQVMLTDFWTVRILDIRTLWV